MGTKSCGAPTWPDFLNKRPQIMKASDEKSNSVFIFVDVACYTQDCTRDYFSTHWDVRTLMFSTCPKCILAYQKKFNTLRFFTFRSWSWNALTKTFLDPYQKKICWKLWRVSSTPGVEDALLVRTVRGVFTRVRWMHIRKKDGMTVKLFSYKSYVFMTLVEKTCFLTIHSSLLLKMIRSKHQLERYFFSLVFN